MPPKKAKKLSDAEAQKIILEELQKQNRPFNHTLLHATLHGTVTKTQCQSLLDTLADKGKLIRKEFGKAKVYWADQEGLESVPPEKLKEIDKQIEAKKQQIKELSSQVSSLSSDLSNIVASQTTEDVLANISRLTSENEVLDAKKLKLKEAAKSTDPADLELLNKQVEFTQSVWRKRKRQCHSILDSIGDGMDKKRSELIEELGLETDEELGVSLPGPAPSKRRKLN